MPPCGAEEVAPDSRRAWVAAIDEIKKAGSAIFSKIKRWSNVTTAFAAATVLASTALGTAALSRADETAYLVNVTVRPGYHFADAASALSYGYGLCESIRRGEGYPGLARQIKSDFGTVDEFQVSYLLSQATQELCPGQIWQLRQSAGGYRASP